LRQRDSGRTKLILSRSGDSVPMLPVAFVSPSLKVCQEVCGLSEFSSVHSCLHASSSPTKICCCVEASKGLKSLLELTEKHKVWLDD